MAADVKVPSVGESVQEATIFKWHKNSGDYVKMDQVIVELETDKATVEVVAEVSGVIKTMSKQGDNVKVGQVIAQIDTAAAQPAASQDTAAPKAVPAPPVAKASAPAESKAAPSKQVAAESSSHLSPAVNRMVAEHKLDPSRIDATGKGGRITKGDVVKHMESGSESVGGAALHVVARQAPASSAGGERRVPMTTMRKRIAERMIQAQQSAAILTTFNEVDMSAVMELRKLYKDSFKEKHGINLGFMSFFVKATIEALKSFPELNGWIEGNEIVYHDYYDIGVAVSSPRGLVVPVVRGCDGMSFSEVEKAIGEYGVKAKDGKLTVDEMQGGTFTISNGGVFGSLMSTPILNPPQSGILGMHAIKERPVVVNGQIVIRPMMYLALSYDHRIVDGKGAVSFLVKIKDCIEDPARIMLGV
jgi:2-oxoglutarate dehydrogenase E2 component (dihydrolipoamide succinyltransferase)